MPALWCWQGSFEKTMLDSVGMAQPEKIKRNGNKNSIFFIFLPSQITSNLTW